MFPERIAAIGVVIPAHNEAELIAECLGSVREAASRVPLPVLVAVVDDASEDGTADVARAELAPIGGLVLPGVGRNVGAARALGFEHVLSNFAVLAPGKTWIATTDADSTVPPGWLAHQVERANAGVDALAGLIDISSHSALHRIFAPLYERGITGGTHTHVHGANMSMRGSVYRAAGGFQASSCSEDVSLWARISALPGVRAMADPQLVVRTSARLQSRVEGGFATYISNMPAAG